MKLIPLEELGRPRIDVVVQTSGQFRDLAASRISLINQAVQLAAKAQEPELYANYVREGAQLAEAVMKENGLPPAEARQLSTVRVFGGLNGSYGAGITGLAENGDRYDLGIESWFRKINPYALQEMTAVMLEVVRKGYWQPDETVIRRIANLHAQLVTDHEAGCSGFVCDNRALRDMLSSYLDDDLKASLGNAVDRVRESRVSEEVTGVQLTKTDTSELRPKHTETEETSGSSRFVGLIALLAALSLSGLVIRKRNGQTPAP